jgi:ABC-type antimicrobial peptide transport system permease subunit
VLRAIGLKKSRIVFLYIYEAFILVISSSFLGIGIGTIIGFSMTLQQALFTQIPANFFFPLDQFFLILGISIICAFLATFGPSRRLLKNEISQIFRLT